MLHLVSLGSSFAAGPGIPPSANKEAGRSANNYSSLFAARIGAKHTDLTVSGATLLNLLSEPQNSFPPQISQIPEDADIVTITGGGNDIGFVGGLFSDSVRTYTLGPLFLYLTGFGAPAAPPISEETLVERLCQVYDAIKAKAPKARIVLVEYLCLLGEGAKTGPYNPLNEEQIEKHRAVQAMLNRASRASVVGQKGVEIVPVSEISWTHGVGSDEEWVNGWLGFEMFRGKAPWHPNAAGMKAVSDILYEKLGPW